MPVVYVSDLQRSRSFYEELGFGVRAESRGGSWVELCAGDALLALHETSPETFEGPRDESGPGRVELSLVATETLEAIRDKLRAAGGAWSVGSIIDEAFGRSLTILDPDGLPIQINEHDEELYT